jgi:hypothetical protein
MLWRIVSSISTLVVAIVVHDMWGTTHSILSAEGAGTQFQNSDSAVIAYTGFLSGLEFVNGGIVIATLAVLYFIWRSATLPEA